jgi:hypothetical protein
VPRRTGPYIIADRYRLQRLSKLGEIKRTFDFATLETSHHPARPKRGRSALELRQNRKAARRKQADDDRLTQLRKGHAPSDYIGVSDAYRKIPCNRDWIAIFVNSEINRFKLITDGTAKKFMSARNRAASPFSRSWDTRIRTWASPGSGPRVGP